jgi:uncharacterized protein with HEPN domain
MNERDKTRLRDMLDEAQRVQKFVTGKTRDDLSRDDMLAYAIVLCLEIIGEAASQVTETTRSVYLHLAWHQMIGMRNRLIHEYGKVDLDIVWYTVIDVIPELITELEQILASN